MSSKLFTDKIRSTALVVLLFVAGCSQDEIPVSNDGPKKFVRTDFSEPLKPQDGLGLNWATKNTSQPAVSWELEGAFVTPKEDHSTAPKQINAVSISFRFKGTAYDTYYNFVAGDVAPATCDGPGSVLVKASSFSNIGYYNTSSGDIPILGYSVDYPVNNPQRVTGKACAANGSQRSPGYTLGPVTSFYPKVANVAISNIKPGEFTCTWTKPNYSISGYKTYQGLKRYTVPDSLGPDITSMVVKALPGDDYYNNCDISPIPVDSTGVGAVVGNRTHSIQTWGWDSQGLWSYGWRDEKYDVTVPGYPINPNITEAWSAVKTAPYRRTPGAFTASTLKIAYKPGDDFDLILVTPPSEPARGVGPAPDCSARSIDGFTARLGATFSPSWLAMYEADPLTDYYDIRAMHQSSSTVGFVTPNMVDGIDVEKPGSVVRICTVRNGEMSKGVLVPVDTLFEYVKSVTNIKVVPIPSVGGLKRRSIVSWSLETAGPNDRILIERQRRLPVGYNRFTWDIIKNISAGNQQTIITDDIPTTDYNNFPYRITHLDASGRPSIPATVNLVTIADLGIRDLVFSDAFDRADSETLGTGWSANSSAALRIAGGKLVSTDISSAVAATASTSFLDVGMAADFNFGDTDSNGVISFIVTDSDPNSTGTTGISGEIARTDGEYRLQVYRKIDGKWTLAQSEVIQEVASAGHLEMTVAGDKIIVSVDDLAAFVVTDPTISSGFKTAAIRLSGVVGASIDNLKVYGNKTKIQNTIAAAAIANGIVGFERIFADDFNRPDSGDLGYDWDNATTQSRGSRQVILANGKLQTIGYPDLSFAKLRSVVARELQIEWDYSSLGPNTIVPYGISLLSTNKQSLNATLSCKISTPYGATSGLMVLDWGGGASNTSLYTKIPCSGHATLQVVAKAARLAVGDQVIYLVLPERATDGLFTPYIHLVDALSGSSIDNIVVSGYPESYHDPRLDPTLSANLPYDLTSMSDSDFSAVISSLGDIYKDSFDRPDSADLGAPWQNLFGNKSGSIVDGKLADSIGSVNSIAWRLGNYEAMAMSIDADFQAAAAADTSAGTTTTRVGVEFLDPTGQIDLLVYVEPVDTQTCRIAAWYKNENLRAYSYSTGQNVPCTGHFSVQIVNANVKMVVNGAAAGSWFFPDLVTYKKQVALYGIGRYGNQWLDNVVIRGPSNNSSALPTQSPAPTSSTASTPSGVASPSATTVPTATPTESYLFQDSFTRADSGTIGNGWVQTGDPIMTSGRVRARGAGTSTLMQPSYVKADVIVGLNIDNVSSGYNDTYVDLVARSSSNGAAYLARYGRNGSGQVIVQIMYCSNSTASSCTTLKQGTVTPLRADIAFKVSGSSLSMSVDGSEVLSTIDTRLTSGSTGIRLVNNYGPIVDNFTLADVSAAAPTAVPTAVPTALPTATPTPVSTPVPTAAPTVMPFSFSDTFDRADSGTIGNGWVQTGDPLLTSGRVRARGAGTSTLMQPSYVRTDVTVGLNIDNVSSGHNDTYVDLVARSGSNGAAYLARYGRNSSGQVIVQLMYCSSSAASSCSTLKQGTVTPTRADIAFKVSGSSLSMSVDGSEVLSTTDTRLTSGTTGIRLVNNYGPIVDNFTLSVP